MDENELKALKVYTDGGFIHILGTTLQDSYIGCSIEGGHVLEFRKGFEVNGNIHIKDDWMWLNMDKVEHVEKLDKNKIEKEWEKDE